MSHNAAAEKIAQAMERAEYRLDDGSADGAESAMLATVGLWADATTDWTSTEASEMHARDRRVRAQIRALRETTDTAWDEDRADRSRA